MSEHTLENVVDDENINQSPNDFFDNFDNDTADDIDIEGDTEFPAFPFDEPRVVTLKNGTEHHFNIPTLAQEKRSQALQRTIIVTSPAIVHGQNPRKITTDYSRSRVIYYQDVIAKVKGYALDEGDDPNVLLDAQKVIREDPIEGTDKVRPIKLASLIPVTHQRAAAERMYGGKMEIVKPELKEGEKAVVVLNSRRFIKVKHDIGVEQNDDGSFTRPSHRLYYFFKEATSANLSKWETGTFDGFTINNPKGGSKEERTYNVEACAKLFDSMIDQITGGSVGGADVDVKNADHLATVPDAIKTQAIAFVMNDVTTDSGN